MNYKQPRPEGETNLVTTRVCSVSTNGASEAPFCANGPEAPGAGPGIFKAGVAEFSSKRGGGVQPLTREQFVFKIFSKKKGGGGGGGVQPLTREQFVLQIKQNLLKKKGGGGGGGCGPPGHPLDLPLIDPAHLYTHYTPST